MNLKALFMLALLRLWKNANGVSLESPEVNDCILKSDLLCATLWFFSEGRG